MQKGIKWFYFVRAQIKWSWRNIACPNVTHLLSFFEAMTWHSTLTKLQESKYLCHTNLFMTPLYLAVIYTVINLSFEQWVYNLFSCFANAIGQKFLINPDLTGTNCPRTYFLWCYHTVWWPFVRHLHRNMKIETWEFARKSEMCVCGACQNK